MDTETLGPQGEQVAALIERAGRLTAAEFHALADAGDAPWQVRKAARSAAREAGRTDPWDAVQDAIYDVADALGWDAVKDAARDGARNAAHNAALAFVVRDLITPGEFGLLYGPWASVTGPAENTPAPRETE